MITIVYISLLFVVPFIQSFLVDHPNWNLFDHEQCGESQTTDRIIGGQQAALGQLPWMARLGYTTRIIQIYTITTVNFKCGGTLINKLYVLTAAHCVLDLKGDVLTVIRLGEHNANTEKDCEDRVCAPPVQDFQPKVIISHPNFQNPFMSNDIALIRLDAVATYKMNVQPLCLPYGTLLTKNWVGLKAEVAGWGISNINFLVSSPELLLVKIPIVNNSICEDAVKFYAHIGPGQICAGGTEGHDSCGGDSGGPLMKVEAVSSTPRYFIIGIVSFGSQKCGSTVPAIYTHVGYFLKWVLDNIRP